MAPLKKRGFTIIELIVVIAIIVILMSVVMSMLGESRQKARNAARLAGVNEYVKALELVHNENQVYPATGASFRCLGDYGDDACWDNGTTEDLSAGGLSSQLQPFITLPPGDLVMVDGTTPREGYRYRAPSPTLGGGYEIEYVLEGADRMCLSGQTPLDPMYGTADKATYCVFRHE